MISRMPTLVGSAGARACALVSADVRYLAKRRTAQTPISAVRQKKTRAISFDHLIGLGEKSWRDGQPERFCGVEINCKLKRAGSSTGISAARSPIGAVGMPENANSRNAIAILRAHGR
jgi:hypothetical protein